VQELRESESLRNSDYNPDDKQNMAISQYNDNLAIDQFNQFQQNQ
jgi:hypothetical protein